jgi:tetratricopeptide (TPR) repeat protein
MAPTENHWDAWRRGEWEQVEKGLSGEIEERPRNAPSYSNRALCRLQMRRFEEALADFQTAHHLSPISDGYLTKIGVVLWWLRRTDEAIASWRLGLNAKYTDAAGGVILPALLLFASIRMDDSTLRKDSQALLKKRWRTKQAKSAWPGPVVALLLGHLSENEFLGLRPFANPVMDARRACQACFWAGVQRLRAEDQSSYLARLTDAVSDVDPGHSIAVRLETEYWLATAELALSASCDP